MAATAVGRQSLYDTFGDKRALYLRALEAYRDSTQAALRALFASGHPLRECFAAMLFGIVDESRADHEAALVHASGTGAGIQSSRNDRCTV